MAVMTRSSLVEVFRRAVGGAGSKAGLHDAALQAELERAHAVARADVRGVDIAPERFVAHLAECLRSSDVTPEAIARLRVSEVYLVLGCLLGAPAAISAFERMFVPAIRRAVSRASLDEDQAADLEQELRLELYGAASRPPLLARFRGTGSLEGWIRTVALRRALRHRSATEPETPDVASLLAAPGRTPELAFVSEKSRLLVEGAMREAASFLSSEERAFLRHYYAEGLGVERIGTMYSVHHSTAARRIERARLKLLARVRRRLADQLGAAAAEIDSLIRTIQSDFQLSARTLFAPSSP
jgi:RNA polymerase sigma-70 factor (ECF subfamily)